MIQTILILKFFRHDNTDVSPEEEDEPLYFAKIMQGRRNAKQMRKFLMHFELVSTQRYRDTEIFFNHERTRKDAKDCLAKESGNQGIYRR